MLLFTALNIKVSEISQQGSFQIQLKMQEMLELFQVKFLLQLRMETVIIMKKQTLVLEDWMVASSLEINKECT
jgi:hypothetical protein